jgi:putative transcriptional regulator
MSPEGKTSKPVRRKSAGLGDNASGDDGYLDGRLLIAMPVMGDPRF